VELGIEEDGKKKKHKNRNAVNLLTSDQKYDIANVVNEDLQAELETHRKNSEKMIDTLRAVLEETEIRIGELRRDAYEFKRDVVVGAENARTGKIMSERVTRYFEDKVKQVDAIIEKLRLKISTLKSQISKLEHQMTQKEEIGDALHYIDFHQLQIENKQYVAKIGERNDELLTVKLSTGKTIQALNEYKRRLHEKLEEGDWLKNEVTTKKSQLQKLSKENTRAVKETRTEKRQRNTLRVQVEDASEMPNVEDYILQKRDMYELETSLKNWRRKVEIMDMAAKRARAMKASAGNNNTNKSALNNM
jgi:chromosome segregation ATPase